MGFKEMSIKECQLCFAGKRGPVGAFKGNILVIIKYRNVEHIGLKSTHILYLREAHRCDGSLYYFNNRFRRAGCSCNCLVAHEGVISQSLVSENLFCQYDQPPLTGQKRKATGKCA
jgi:hypothetical protein